MRMVQVALVAAVLATAGSVRLSGGQAFPMPSGSKTGQMPGTSQPGHNNPTDPDASPLDPHREEKQAELRNTDRQKRLVADTDKLLALATDLKAQVDKSTKDTLSVDVIKKADEIEKLAHSVKERMKG
jgi:hypothetical protein